MKHLKTYEQNNNKLKIGDYVIQSENRLVNYVDDTIDEITEFVSSNIGQYIKLLPSTQEDVMFDWRYVIQYENVPEYLKEYFTTEKELKNCRRTGKENIKHFSENKEELEIILTAKKYNL